MTPEEELANKRGRFTFESEQAEQRAAGPAGDAEEPPAEGDAPEDAAAAEPDPAPEKDGAGFPKGKKAAGG